MHLPTQCEGYIITVRNIEIWAYAAELKLSLKLRAYGLFRKVLGIDFYKSGKKIAQQKKEITKFVPFPSLSKLRNKKNVT